MSGLQPMARLGDALSSGGSITSASSVLTSDDIPVARVGDSTYCPLKDHGAGTITSGSPYVFESGIPIAHVGSSVSCGCTVAAGSPVVKVGT